MSSLNKLLFLLALVALLGVTLSNDFSDCGTNTAPPKGSKAASKQKITNIIGGQETATHGWPWQVLIFIEQQDDSWGSARNINATKRVKNRFHCGGSIISNDYILTAAHCIFAGERVPDESFSFFVGRHNKEKETESGSQALRAEKIIIHEGYKPPSLADDIALIKVKPPIVWSRTVRRVCLPKEDPREGQICAVTGWGKTASDYYAEYLQQAYMPIVKQSVCVAKFKSATKITPKQICSGKGKGVDSCIGDSGGPLVCRKGSVWNLNGIVSFGTEQCATGLPGIYTRVTKYMNWIADKSGVTGN